MSSVKDDINMSFRQMRDIENTYCKLSREQRRKVRSSLKQVRHDIASTTSRATNPLDIENMEALDFIIGRTEKLCQR